jgi:hypothetical protein
MPVGDVATHGALVSLGDYRASSGTLIAPVPGVLRLQIPLLERAAEILGGREKLCDHLAVSEFQLGFWRSGRVKLPDAMFVRVVDLVLKDDIARAASDRRRQPRWDEAFRTLPSTSEKFAG